MSINNPGKSLEGGASELFSSPQGFRLAEEKMTDLLRQVYDEMEEVCSPYSMNQEASSQSATTDGLMSSYLDMDTELQSVMDECIKGCETTEQGFNSDFTSLTAKSGFDTINSYYFLESKTSLPASNDKLDITAIRKDFPVLDQEIKGKPLVWLDNAATTQKPSSVIDKVSAYYKQDNSNIHRGAHDLAARSTDAYEYARRRVAEFINAGSEKEIVFVRGTTEGINFIAQSYGRKFIKEGDEIILTTLEHHANIVPWQLLAQETGAVIKVVPIDSKGDLILEEFERLLGPKTKIASFAHVSNVLGTVNPVKEMVAMAKRFGVTTVVDGAQGIPHQQVDVADMDCDFYVFSGHKLFAPTGIGAVYGKESILRSMPPWQGGGNMIVNVSFEKITYQDAPMRFEAGTAAIAQAIGLAAAIDYLESWGWANLIAYEESLMHYAQDLMADIPYINHIGTSDTKIGVLAFTMNGIDSALVGKFLSNEAIALRAGHHCAQPTLAHFGLEAAVRPSLAFYNTREEVDILVDAIKRAYTFLS